MQVGQRLADRAHEVEVPGAREAGVDAALQADLGGAAIPRLGAAPHDLVDAEQVGGPAQVGGQAALRERAEAAAEVADVGVVDVPADDVGDVRRPSARRGARRPRGSAARPPGRGRSAAPRRRPRPGRRRARCGRARGRTAPRPSRRGAGGAALPGRRRLRARAGEPRALVARQSLAVRGGQRGPAHGRREPALGIAQEARVDAQPRRERAVGRWRSRRPAAQRSGHGASGLTWSGVTGETPPKSSMPASSRRGNSACARFGGACTATSSGISSRVIAIVQRWSSSEGSGGLGHLRAGLGAEVLDDHLLQVTVALVQLAQREQRLDALAPRLADADQDAARVRDREPPGAVDRVEAHLGQLVGRAEVRHRRAATGARWPSRA